MHTADDQTWSPRYPWLWAALVFALGTLALAYPALGGGFLVTPISDQYIGGRYPFAEEGRIGRWRRSWRNASRPRGRIDIPEPRLVFGPSLPDSHHHTRMNPPEHSRRQRHFRNATRAYATTGT